MIRVDLASFSDESREEYLDGYEGITSEILNTTRSNENSDLSATYLGKSHMTCKDKLMIQEKFSITKQGHIVGKLLYGTECQILLDTGANKLFMSKSDYLHCKSLHSLPKFVSKTQRIHVGNGQYVNIHFVIPIIIDIHVHRFEIYTLVSEIHENVDIVLGIKNVFELEGVINSLECCFSFLNRLVPIFTKEQIILKPKEQKLVTVEVPFSDEISGLAIVKLLNMSTHSVIVLKVKFVWNVAILDMTKSSSEILILIPKEALGILNLTSLGYYKIKQGVLQQNVGRYYKFDSAEKVRAQFNNLINTTKKEQSLETGEKYPWLDDTDERKYMKARGILEKMYKFG